MKKIVFVLEMLSSGGAERVTSILANEFAQIGYDIHLITTVEKEDEYKLDYKVTRYNIGLNNNESRIKNIILKYKGFKRYISEVNPDVVISLSTPKTNILLTLISKISGFKLILSERNDPQRFPTGFLLRKLRDICYLFCDFVVFQTPDAQKYFRKVVQKKSHVIPNPVKNDLPDVYVGPRAKKIVNFCRLEPQKNLRLLIDAFILLNKDFPEYELHLYGNGPLRNELEKYIYIKGMESKIKVFEFQSNIHNLIRDATLYVSSSNYEGISNSMIEAMALGIPTICTDCPIGGARMMIENEINGMLVPVNDTKAMYEAMKKVINDNSLLVSLSEKASSVRNDLSSKTIANKWRNVINNVG